MEGIVLTSKSELDAYIQSSIDQAFKRNLKKVKSTIEEPIKSGWLTVKQKAKQENISTSMVYKLISNGTYETRKIGRRTQVKI